MSRQAEKGAAFRALHAGDAFVIPNPWDAGSARVLAALGFRALATTSSGFAFTLGRPDGGVTLDPPGSGLPPGDVLALALSSYFAVDPVLFAAIEGKGLHRSPDGGRNWLPAGLDGETVRDLVWLGPFLYAAGDGGVRRSEDLGRTWTPLNEGLKGLAGRRLLFPLAPAAGAEAFLGTEDGVFHTPDGGLHWNGPTLKGRRVLSLATFPPPIGDPQVKHR